MANARMPTLCNPDARWSATKPICCGDSLEACRLAAGESLPLSCRNLL
jgi:hypothetical protein